MKKYVVDAFRLFLPIILGSFVGFIIKNSIDYNMLVKPAFSPSSVIFPIVWTILYLLMGIAYFLIKKTKKEDTENESFLYYAQLFVNLVWPIIFFVLKWYFTSIVWILLLLVLVIPMVLHFYEKNKWAGILMIPYVLWILFATYLTIGVFILN